MFIAITSDFIRKICYEINNIHRTTIVNDNNVGPKDRIHQYIEDINKEIRIFIYHFKKCLNDTFTTFNHHIDSRVEQLLSRHSLY